MCQFRYFPNNTILGAGIYKSMKEKYIILSVIGTSAGEKIEGILKRKIDDINKIGFTFWVYKSNQASPKTVQNFC